MILAIDIGNTEILAGCIENGTIIFSERLSTVNSRTDLEYATIFRTLLEIHNLSEKDFSGAIIASEVPPLTDIVKDSVKKFFSLDAMVVGPGVKNGLNIRMDNPAQVGSGVIINAVAAVKEYGAPVVVIDMSTATTISVIDNTKSFIGGSILPGPIISFEALVNKTSQLQRIDFKAPKNVIGKNTIDSMKSGLILGQASCIDGMIDRIFDELGYKAKIVATGNVATRIIPYCHNKITYDENLSLKGLTCIFEKNAGF